MRRRLVRVLMAAMGLLSLATYVAGAWLTYLFLRVAWANRPPAALTVLGLAGVSFASGYLSYRFGTERLLASMALDRPSEAGAPALYDSLDRLCAAMALNRPRLYVSDLGEPNAFAMSGRAGGAVVVDRELFRLLTVAEFEAVLAHELAHLESHDSLVQLLAFAGLQTVVQVLVLALLPGLLLFTGLAKADAWFRGRPGAWSSTVSWRVRTLVVAAVLLVPLAVTFVLLVRSRRREFAADARAAEVTGAPLALARALRKIDRVHTDLSLRTLLRPRPTRSDPLARLLATHPAIEDRIARLRDRADASP